MMLVSNCVVFKFHWPPDVNSGLSGKDPDTGNKLKAEEKRMAEDEMVGLHH